MIPMLKFAAKSIKSNPQKVGGRYHSFLLMAVAVWDNVLFCMSGWPPASYPPSLACWELGLQMWAIKSYSSHQCFAKSFQDVSGIISKVDRHWSGFHIFGSVYRHIASTSLFCPSNFSEVLGSVTYPWFFQLLGSLLPFNEEGMKVKCQWTVN